MPDNYTDDKNDAVGPSPELPEFWQAYSYDSKNNRSAGMFVGTLAGSKEICIEWLDATSPGWRNDFEMGRAALRPLRVWHITQEKLEADRKTVQEKG